VKFTGVRSPTGRVLARAGATDRLADAIFDGARLFAPAVREVVRRRAHQPVPQRRRPASRNRGDQPALIYLSTETGETRRYSYEELHAEVNRFAAILVQLGVGKGDRVLVYMPMIPEATLAMLACVRIGAIHSVVFGGFAAASLATRIDDAKPKVMVTADAGMRAGKAVPYKHLVDESIRSPSIRRPMW